MNRSYDICITHGFSVVLLAYPCCIDATSRGSRDLGAFKKRHGFTVPTIRFVNLVRSCPRLRRCSNFLQFFPVVSSQRVKFFLHLLLGCLWVSFSVLFQQSFVGLLLFLTVHVVIALHFPQSGKSLVQFYALNDEFSLVDFGFRGHPDIVR